MRITLVSTAIVGVLILWTPPAGLAQPIAPAVTDLEFKCMANASGAGGKLVVARMKCTSKCVAYIRKGLLADDPATCFVPPFNNALMASCVAHAESRFLLSFRRKCDASMSRGAECPECYAAGDCVADSTVRSSQVAGLIAGFGPAVFCERTGAFPLEMHCETATAKVVSKYAATLGRCYDRCFALVRKGVVAVADCGPPATAPVVQSCLARARQNAIDAIDQACHPPPGSPDGCGGPYPDGAGWVAQVETTFAPDVSVTYCGSPGAAFVD